MAGEAEDEGQCGLQRFKMGFGDGCAGRRLTGQPVFGDDRVELVVAQVVRDRHAFQRGAAVLDLQRGLVKADVERHGGAVAPGHQGVGLHHLVGQHGDLVARHVDGGQAVARDLVDGTLGCDGQTGCCDVDAQRDGAAAQSLQ
ncbi:hypothetical protein D9M69_575710 [compost metagenome]